MSDDQTEVHPHRPQTLREPVRALAEWGPLPPEDTWEPDAVDALQEAIRKVQTPISEPELQAILVLLDRPWEDDIYGVAQGLIPLVESYPDDRWVHALDSQNRPWFQLLQMRLCNYRRRHTS